jgi:hypothetical protein
MAVGDLQAPLQDLTEMQTPAAACFACFVLLFVGYGTDMPAYALHMTTAAAPMDPKYMGNWCQKPMFFGSIGSCWQLNLKLEWVTSALFSI